MGIEERKKRISAIHREEIVDAAERLFLRKNYHEVSMDEISKEAEFTKKTIYAYFASKELLYIEIMIRGYHKLLNHLEKAMQLSSQKLATAQIQELGLAYMEFSLKHPNYYQAITDYENQERDFTVSTTQEASKKELYTLGEQSMAYLIEAVSAGISKGEILQIHDPISTSVYLWSCLTGILHVLHRKKHYLEKGKHIEAKTFATQAIMQLVQSLNQKERGK